MTKEEAVGSLFSKYRTIKDPLISQLLSSIPETFSDASNKILSLGFNNTINSNNIVKNRAELAKFVIQYHTNSDSMTSKVQNNIKLLYEPTTQLLVSMHQPNLFPYGGVFKKILLLEALKNVIEKGSFGNRFINLFVIVDHDFMDEVWVRKSELPSIDHSLGVLDLRMPVDKKARWLMIKNFPLPSRVNLENWKAQIITWIKKSLVSHTSEFSDKSSILNNFEEFWMDVEYSYSKAKSYSDFNSFLMSSIINKSWNYGTLFVRLSDISSAFENGFKYLILNHEKYLETLGNLESIFKLNNIETGVGTSTLLHAPLWLHCQCGSKAPTKIYKNQDQILSLQGECKSCYKHLHVSIGNNNDLDLSAEILRDLSPRAIPILLLLSRELGITCYASGTAGMKYIIFGSALFNKLSIDMPVILVWPSKDIYHGIGQSRALKSIGVAMNTNINIHLASLKQSNFEYENKIKSLLKEDKNRRKGDKFSRNQIYQNFHYLKKEQDKVTHLLNAAVKVKNIMDLTPGFIDYAVNFGIKNIELQWHQNLLKQNNLSAPLFLDPKRKNIVK